MAHKSPQTIKCWSITEKLNKDLFHMFARLTGPFQGDLAQYGPE